NPAPVRQSRRRLRVLVAALAALIIGGGLWIAFTPPEPAQVEVQPAPVVPPSIAPVKPPVTDFALMFDRETSVVIPNQSFEGMTAFTIEFTCVPEAADYPTSTHLIGVPRQ